MNWFEQPQFWARFYDWMFSAESFEQAETQTADLMQLLEIDSGAVLDLCCGPGRHSIPLAKAGFRVAAVDRQPLLLEKARDYAARERAEIEFVQEDMRRFERPESFDAIVNMFSSFGYFEDPDDDLKVLQNAHRSLKRGGQLLIDIRGKEVHAMNFVETLSSELENGDLVVQRTRTNEDWTRAVTKWVYVQGAWADTFEIALNLYSGAELRDLLRTAGFPEVQLYGSLKGAPYDHTARRLIAVARKHSAKGQFL